MLRDRLRWNAADALADRIGDRGVAYDPTVDPLDIIRYLVRLAEERHIPAPGEENP